VEFVENNESKLMRVRMSSENIILVQTKVRSCRLKFPKILRWLDLFLSLQYLRQYFFIRLQTENDSVTGV